MSGKIINYKGEDVLKAVHKINFGEGGILDIGSEELTYDRGFREAKPCLECDKMICGEEIATRKSDNKFTNVSHGAHILDYINAYNENDKHDKISVEGWSDCPVIFVMENPSINKGQYEVEDWGKIRVLPKQWYWDVKGYKECENFIMPQYPENFVPMAYSGLFSSVANTFKLKNAYLTNMVKCGISYKVNGIEKAINTDKYDYKDIVIETCIKKLLVQEIDALRRTKDETVIVFAFGRRVYDRILRYKKNNNDLGSIAVCYLPHPASGSSDRKITLENAFNNVLIKYRDVIINSEKNGWINGSGYSSKKQYEFCGDCVIFRYETNEGEYLEDGGRRIWIEYTFANSSYEINNFQVETKKRGEDWKTIARENFEKYTLYREVKGIIDSIINT